MFYHKTDFSFSPKAVNWVVDKFKEKFNSKFPHDLDIEQDSGILQLSPMGKELIAFLKKYNLRTNYMGIGAFVSNSDTWFEGNPHIDIKFNNADRDRPIRTRFNVMVLGNPKDTMFWWTKYNFESKDLVINDFITVTGLKYSSRSIPGKDPKERWDHLGEPNEQAVNLLTPSAFVKTDCVHTVNVSPGPRLIISVAFEESIEDIIAKIKSS
jgi:hypothetical protein